MGCEGCVSGAITPMELYNIFIRIADEKIEEGITADNQFVLNWLEFKTKAYALGWRSGDDIRVYNNGYMEVING